MQWWELHFLVKSLYFISYGISNVVVLGSAWFWCWNGACVGRGVIILLPLAQLLWCHNEDWTIEHEHWFWILWAFFFVQWNYIISAWMTRVFKWHLVDANWPSNFLAFQQEQADNTCYLHFVMHSHNGCFAVLPEEAIRSSKFIEVSGLKRV